MLKNGLLTVYSPRFSVVSSFLFSVSKVVNHQNVIKDEIIKGYFLIILGRGRRQYQDEDGEEII